MLNPENIDVEESLDFETGGVVVFARFRACVAIDITGEELMNNPRAVIDAKTKVRELLAANPDAYSVGQNARSLHIRTKDLP